eukprot:CAMPEP_0182534858 /NCGR_PEP_ID=MMETSP1323-20130603/16525_1 /TAXON_ID=236787 /ORGANISM="Florenciella parvula, Strain RCC1693" /LENGTH=173 /DNA_ID=CAMNT_0024744917 /DNA_START=318 /DNA_END=839 /DNA_ORIENTATION=-
MGYRNGTACECPRVGTTEGLHRTSSYHRRPPRTPATSTSSLTAAPEPTRPYIGRVEGGGRHKLHMTRGNIITLSHLNGSKAGGRGAAKGSCPRSWRGPGKPAAFPFTATGPARPFTPGLDLALGGGADACTGAANDKGPPRGMCKRHAAEAAEVRGHRAGWSVAELTRCLMGV